MTQLLTHEQNELRATLRKFFAKESPLTEVRSVATGKTGYDGGLWQRMSDELGLPGIAIPEQYGGAGFGLAELAVVTEELGRALVPSPYLASAVVAATMLAELADPDVNREVLADIAVGDVVGTATFDILFGVDARAVTAQLTGDGPRLTGSAGAVLDAAEADVLIIVAGQGRERSAYLIELAAAGVTRTPLSGLDLTRRYARVDLDGVAARQVICSDTEAALGRARDRISVALAAELLGVLRYCVDTTVEYVKGRVQFGRPVGGFQAVKHGCADMWVRYELAESAVRHAAAVGDVGGDELSAAAALALAYTCEAATATADDMIQFHGGIAYTWEHDAHLFYRRAHAAAAMFGRPAAHRARLADLLGI